MTTEFKLDIRETFNGDLMVKEIRDSKFSIPFDKSVSITIVRKKTTTDETVVKAFVHDHSIADVINRFFIKSDGRYIVTHAVVPTEQWLDTIDQTEQTLLVFIEGTLSEFSNGVLTPVEIDVLYNTSLVYENIQVETKEAFVLYNLWQCYLNYCKKLFEDECSKDTRCSNCNDELSYNRGLIWIFLNNIQYLMQLGRPDEAQKLLEEISGCNSLCANEMFSKDYNCGCG